MYIWESNLNIFVSALLWSYSIHYIYFRLIRSTLVLFGLVHSIRSILSYSVSLGHMKSIWFTLVHYCVVTKYKVRLYTMESRLTNVHDIKNNNENWTSGWMVWKSIGRIHCNPYQSKKIQTLKKIRLELFIHEKSSNIIKGSKFFKSMMKNLIPRI